MVVAGNSTLPSQGKDKGGDVSIQSAALSLIADASKGLPSAAVSKACVLPESSAIHLSAQDSPQWIPATMSDLCVEIKEGHEGPDGFKSKLLESPPKQAVSNQATDQAQQIHDPHIDCRRPIFHVMPARGWASDPSGPIFYKGRYHM
jgi:hypothetical protein